MGLVCIYVITDPTVDISKVQEVTLTSYIPHPVCVTGVMLTSLKIDCKLHVVLYFSLTIIMYICVYFCKLVQ